MRQDLLDKINDYGHKLGAVSKWTGSGSAFGHIDFKSKDDYVYEFFCYVSILYDLKAHQDIRFVPGIKKGLFPKKPANKDEGWARFDVFDGAGNCVCQACAGTSIKLSDCPTTEFAPDISFQTPNASDDPDEREVVLVMDAKFKDKKGSIDFALIKEFMAVVASLQVGIVPSSFGLQFEKFVQLKANCLISNGTVMKKHENFCKKTGIRQVGRFGTKQPLEVAG